MTIYFAFSDECGDYKRLRSQRFLRAHPYYLRSTLIFEADSWITLVTNICNYRNELELPLNKEIKWSFLWSLEKHRQNNKKIPKNKKYSFLDDIPTDTLQDYIYRCVDCIRQLPGSRIIYTITDNSTCPKHSEQNILKWHLQEILQRIEMDMETNSDNLCVLFMDPVSRSKDRHFRDSYFKLYDSGDRYKTYERIKDSLNFEYSHQSVGIQCADFLSGAFISMLKEYAFGTKLYTEQIRYFIRRSRQNELIGYGVRQVPRGKVNTSDITEKVKMHE